MFASGELESGGVVLKDMKRGSQAVISQGDIVDEVNKILLLASNK